MRNRLVLALSVALVATASGAQAQRSPVEVPIQVFNNHVYLRMQSGGQDLWFLLDTGAGLTLMDMAAAQALGVPLGEPANIGGAGPGVARGALLSNVKVYLPQDSGLVVSPRVAMPMVGLNTLEGRAVNGILGADFFRQAVVQIEYAQQRILLHDARGFKYSGTGARVPLTFKDNKPHFKGQVVLADGARLTADCHVDVGSSGTLILTKPFVEKNRLLERVGPTIRRRAGGGAGGLAWSNTGRVAAIWIGTEELKSPITAFYGDSAGVFSRGDFDCNVGGEILRRFTVFFDYGRKQMILEPNASLGDPFEADMSGASFRPDSAGAGLRVGELMAGGPAEKAGLMRGDLIVTIDGQPAKTFGIDALRRRLRRDGGEVVFGIARNGESHSVRLPVRRMI